MTGRPGYRTMEMIGGSSAPYLARTPCVPLFCTSFNRVGNKERFRLPGAGGGSFPLYGGTFARSYSVSTKMRATKKPRKSHEKNHEKGPNTVFLDKRATKSHGKATKKQRVKTPQVTKSLLNFCGSGPRRQGASNAPQALKGYCHHVS